MQVGLQLHVAEGLSQAALGAAIDSTLPEVQNCQRGTNRISALMIVKGAAVRSVQASALLPQAEAPVVASPAVHLLRARAPYAQEVVKAFVGIRGREGLS